MESISRIAVFVEVVTQGSFVGAGRALGLSGPAVSKQIQSLESGLGVKLLTRTTRHVATTDEGQRYFDRVSKVLADLNEATAEVQESREIPSGRLKINVPTSFGIKYLAEPLADFARSHPLVNLDVSFSDQWVDVVGDGYDLVVRISALQDSNLVARRLGSCPILLCAAPAYVDKFGAPTTPKDVEQLPAVVYTRHSQREEWRYQDMKTREAGRAQLQRSFAANSGEQQVAACLAGVGVALLPIFLVSEHLAQGNLVQLLPHCKTVPERDIFVMYPQNKFLPTRVRMLIDWLLECSKQYDWQ